MERRRRPACRTAVGTALAVALLVAVTPAGAAPPPQSPGLEIHEVSVAPYPPVTGRPLVLTVTFSAGRGTAGSAAFTVAVEQQGRVLATSRPVDVALEPGRGGEVRKQFTAASPGRYTLRVRLAAGGVAAERTVPIEVVGAGGPGEVDCSHLKGGVLGVDPASGRSACVCRAGSAANAAGTECVDCAVAEGAFRAAAGRGDAAVAERIAAEVPGCPWATGARATVADLLRRRNEAVCAARELDIIQAVNTGDVERTQALIGGAMQEGCAVSAELRQALQRTMERKEAEAQEARRRADQQAARAANADTWRRLANLSAWAMSVGPRGVGQAPPGGWTNPGAVPFLPPAGGPAGTAPAQGSAAPSGAGEEECRKRICPSCASAVTLLGTSVSEECERCLAANAERIRQCVAGGGGASAGPGGVAAVAGRTAGSGQCYVASTWSQPPSYAAACDGGDGPAVWKLAQQSYFVVVLGPASWAECTRFMRSKGVAGW